MNTHEAIPIQYVVTTLELQTTSGQQQHLRGVTHCQGDRDEDVASNNIIFDDTEHESNIVELSPDIVFKILTYCPLPTIIRLSRVSRLWNKLSRDQNLWREICQRMGPKMIEMQTKRDEFSVWKSKFPSRYSSLIMDQCALDMKSAQKVDWRKLCIQRALCLNSMCIFCTEKVPYTCSIPVCRPHSDTPCPNTRVHFMKKSEAKKHYCLTLQDFDRILVCKQKCQLVIKEEVVKLALEKYGGQEGLNKRLHDYHVRSTRLQAKRARKTEFMNQFTVDMLRLDHDLNQAVAVIQTFRKEMVQRFQHMVTEVRDSLVNDQVSTSSKKRKNVNRSASRKVLKTNK